MTSSSAPTLFADSAPVQLELSGEQNSRSLVDLLYDGFFMLTLLHNRKMPTDAEAFTTQVRRFLDEFENVARKHHFNADDIFDAKYAFCAAVDETVLSSRMDIRDTWERHPLQLALFGDQLAGEHFFDKLEAARNGGASRINALEIFHMCLLLGFKGRYLLESPEKLKYLTAQLGEQIAHIKGKPPAFSPRGEPPDQIANALKREIPVWIMGSVLALLSLMAYLALDWYARGSTNRAMEPYNAIVQLAPRAPTLDITLP